MKPLLILCFFPMILIGQKTAFWESKLFFEDGLGNKDSITIGHDLESNGDFNPEFGEINIKDVPWDTIFEVRASHNEAANSIATPKVLSKKIIGSTEAGLHPTYNCLFVREPLKVFVKIKNLPLKISWDSLEHESFCNQKDFLTPHFLPLIFNNWFNDPEFVKDPPYVCLYEKSSFVVDNFSKNNNGFVEYILDKEPDGDIDSIFSLLISFRTLSSGTSPCSGTVDVKDFSELGQSIKVFPNPTNSILKVDYSEPLDWTIMNISGYSILSGKEYEIDVSSLFSGVYLLKIQIGNQVIFKKIVKSE